MDRLAGVVVFVGEGHIRIAAQDGQKYYSHAKNIRAPGNHFCFLMDQDVHFEVARDDRGRIHADDVRLVNESLVELDELEESTVVEWHTDSGFGFAERPCGCRIFLHSRMNRNVRGVGDVIQHKTVHDALKDQWEAINSQIRFSPNQSERQPQRKFEEFKTLATKWRHKSR